MKKLIILTLFILGISSCVNEQATHKKSMLITEVTDKQLHKEFDTLLVIKENERYNIFDNKTNNYIESTYSSAHTGMLGMLLFGILLGILLGSLIFS